MPAAEPAAAGGRPLRAAFALAAAFAAFYAITGTGHSSFSDGHLILISARNLYEQGSPEVPAPRSVSEGLLRLEGADGRYYPKYGPGLAMAHFPAIFAAKQFSLGLRAGGAPLSEERRIEFWAQWTNAWVMAAVVACLFLCGVELGYASRRAAWIAASAGIATPLWLYARLDGTEALQALGLSLATLGALRRPRTLAAAGLVGTGLGIALLTKLATAVVLPIFALYALLTTRGAAERVRVAAAAALPLAISFAALAAYNRVRFGTFVASGYDLGAKDFSEPLLRGLYTLFLSPSFGLIAFWPVALLALAALRRFAQRHPHEALWIVGVLVATALLYARWWANWGVLWGPRFLVPLLPMLSLLLFPIAAEGRVARAILGAFLTLGLAVQLLAVGNGFWTHVGPVWDHSRAQHTRQFFDDPRIAPLRIANWWTEVTLADRRGGRAAADAVLIDPPWSEAYPWKDDARAVATLYELRGFDLWALPDALRLRHLYAPAGEAWTPTVRVPAAVAWALAAACFASLALLLLALRPRASAG